MVEEPCALWRRSFVRFGVSRQMLDKMLRKSHPTAVGLLEKLTLKQERQQGHLDEKITLYPQAKMSLCAISSLVTPIVNYHMVGVGTSPVILRWLLIHKVL